MPKLAAISYLSSCVSDDPKEALKEGLEPKAITILSQPTVTGNNTSRLFPASQKHSVSQE